MSDVAEFFLFLCCRWIDSVFIPSVNAAGDQGWDMVRVATNIKEQAEAHNSEVGNRGHRQLLNVTM